MKTIKCKICNKILKKHQSKYIYSDPDDWYYRCLHGNKIYTFEKMRDHIYEEISYKNLFDLIKNEEFTSVICFDKDYYDNDIMTGTESYNLSLKNSFNYYAKNFHEVIAKYNKYASLL